MVIFHCYVSSPEGVTIVDVLFIHHHPSIPGIADCWSEVILGAAVHGEFHGATLPRHVWLRWALLGFLLAEGAEPDEHLRT